MTGSHRANHRAPKGGSNGLLWLVAALVLVLIAVAIWWALPSKDSTGKTTSTPTTTATSSSSPTATATTKSPSPSPTQSPTPESPGANLPKVDLSAANRIEIGDLVDAGFNNAVQPDDGRLIPERKRLVARWEERGLPGNPTDDTVVFVGAMNADRDSAFGELDQVKKDDEISLRTTGGKTITYRVQRTLDAPYENQTESGLLKEKQPGRLVLVGARYDSSGNRQAEDFYVVATISGVS